MKYFFLFVNIFYFCIISCHYKNDVDDLLKKYTRPITTLEISSVPNCYSSYIASNYANASCAIIFLGDNVNKFVSSNQYNNTIILNPIKFYHDNLITLGRCEHFDVIFAHDLPSHLKVIWDATIKALLKLGDYLFLEIDADKKDMLKDWLTSYNNQYEIIETISNKLICFKTNKQFLDIPAWSKKNTPISATPKYKIESNFNSKSLCKNDKKTPWIQGINLMTFVMLRGVYPPAEIIIKNIKSFKNIYHNDLVLANMIIQGNSIRPIDFNDNRWNLKIKKGIKAALKLFKDKNRLQNPEQSYQNYSHKLK